MGQKDSSEKLLEDYSDVFADIVNVLLFHGERIVKEEDLQETGLNSQYKADDGKLHEQERDVARYWKRGNVKIALCGLENQTGVDNDMPLRIMNYDGASYRSQLLTGKERYPVVTLVLYFGNRPWNGPVSLYEALDIPEELKPYVSDHRMNVVEVASLSEEVVKKFQSDFRIVADFFTRWRKTPDFIPENRKIRHVDELMKFLDVFSHDDRFYKTAVLLKEEGKEVASMCDVLDRIEAKGRTEGREEGRVQGRTRVFVNMIRRGFSVEDAMSLAEITEEQAERALKEMEDN